MKTRAEVAEFIRKQMHWRYTTKTPKTAHHYGWVELRELMDFLYDGPPTSEEEKLNSKYDTDCPD